MIKIGVFDSGIGGKTIADKLQADIPDADILYVDDRAHVPYGDRTKEEIIRLTEAAIQPLLNASCDVIVLACNTATAAAIEHLRSAYPDTPFVGLEPMIKPAASLTRSNIIAVCATPATLSSERYKTLNREYGSHLTILEPDCSKWATMIEHNEVDHDAVRNTIQKVLSNGADVIVLACTHYHWIKDEITQIAADRAVVIEPSEGISKRVRSYLADEHSQRD